MKNHVPDEKDCNILSIIRENARLSYSEIGEKVGLSRVSVKKRMSDMQEEGIIRGYRALIDTSKLPEEAIRAISGKGTETMTGKAQGNPGGTAGTKAATAAELGRIKFFLDIETVPDKYEEVVEYLASSKLIRQIYGVGGECRLHAVGTAPNAREMERFANTVFRSQRGVRRMGWHTALTTIMDADAGVRYERYKEDGHTENDQSAAR